MADPVSQEAVADVPASPAVPGGDSTAAAAPPVAAAAAEAVPTPTGKNDMAAVAAGGGVAVASRAQLPEARAKRKKIKKNKDGKSKRKAEGALDSEPRKVKKIKKKHKDKDGKSSGVAEKDDGSRPGNKKARKKIAKAGTAPAATSEVQISAAQTAVNEQMRKVLEEDQYSAHGSIVETDSEADDDYNYRGETVRIDRSALMTAMRKQLWMERLSGSGNVVTPKPGGSNSTGGAEEVDDDNDNRRGGRKKKKKGKRTKEDERMGLAGDQPVVETSRTADAIVNPIVTDSADVADDFDDRDGGSIFGQTAGSSNATWVECDKCKKWRRLRGVVDEKKLPSRWYCSMNKNDPERARCSAPEEEYETPHTPESAADARTRKHLRVWVRRLQCNEAYEARQPTLTRGRKRATAATAREPYEWIRCCNQSCGKWRAILRCMDAKASVIERTNDGEWYCVMNTWDEKTASCAAPQENLPALGYFSQDKFHY